MARDLEKEAKWAKQVYKPFYFRCRTDNGELDRLQAILGDRSFPEWVRAKMAEDENK